MVDDVMRKPLGGIQWSKLPGVFGLSLLLIILCLTACARSESPVADEPKSTSVASTPTVATSLTTSIPPSATRVSYTPTPESSTVTDDLQPTVILTTSPSDSTPTGGETFVDSGQRLDDQRSWSVALGDLDADADVDALVVNDHRVQVWLNDGTGIFVSGQELVKHFSDLALGDLDGDGDLDAFAVGPERRGEIWLNDGFGFFEIGQRLSSGALGHAIALGDVDGDMDLDAYLASDGMNMLFLNNGQGQFTDSGQRFGSDDPIEDGSIDVVFADLDGDDDTDVFEVVYGGLHRIWFNDGSGNFMDSGQVVDVGEGNSHGVAIGDLDGDGDLDAFVTVTEIMAFQVWFNDGAGVFSNSGQSLPSSNAQKVDLGDLDGDGDLDAFMVNTGTSDEGAGNTIWINNGDGFFLDSGLRLGHEYSLDVALGDLDGDGDLDAFVVNSYFSNATVDKANRVWMNISS